MTHIIVPFIAGLIGSFTMLTLTLVPARLGILRIDVVRAVGALVTHERNSAFMPGMVIHTLVGGFAAIFYKWIFDYMGIPLFWVTGLFAGLVHGVLVMLLVSIFILEHHPVRRYQRRGFGTAFAQIFAHGVFGLIVGFIIGLFTLQNHFWPNANDIRKIEYFGK